MHYLDGRYISSALRKRGFAGSFGLSWKRTYFAPSLRISVDLNTCSNLRAHTTPRWRPALPFPDDCLWPRPGRSRLRRCALGCAALHRTHDYPSVLANLSASSRTSPLTCLNGSPRFWFLVMEFAYFILMTKYFADGTSLHPGLIAMVGRKFQARAICSRHHITFL
eukprot:3408354-Pleurochrysis_carterae.AAC.4